MKRTATGFCVAAAFGCIAMLGAQTSTTPTTAGQSAMDKSRDVTITGCLSKGADGNYMLNNAMMMDHAGAGMGGGAAMPTGAPMSYMLSGGTLKPHVGHKVEVTGMMKPMNKDGMGNDSMAKDGMAKGGMDKGGMMKEDAAGKGGTLTVKDVKMIAATCS